MDQPTVVAFIAFTDTWPKTMETEIGAAQCATGAGRSFNFFDNGQCLSREMKAR